MTYCSRLYTDAHYAHFQLHKLGPFHIPSSPLMAAGKAASIKACKATSAFAKAEVAKNSMFLPTKATTKDNDDDDDADGQDTPQAKAPKMPGSWSGAKN
eukprot:6649353-Heterocapsa_arctica.AAC.1